MPNNLEIIKCDAFFNCEKLESIWISPNVKKIERYAFRSCINLKTLFIDKKMFDKAERGIFPNCPNLKII